MSEVKHTPGNWEVNEGMVTRFPAVKGEGNIICLSPETEKSMMMWEANARLIAAAPELLEALKMVTNPEIKFPDAMRACHAAVAKAEGRT